MWLPYDTALGGWFEVKTVILLLLIAFIVYGFHPVERWRYRHIPGPPVRWLIGSLPEIAAYSVHNAYEMWAREYGKDGIFKVFWGGKPHVVVTSPEFTAKMLATTSNKYCPLVPINHMEKELADNNILFLSGDAWKQRRIPFNQFLFNPEKLQKYFPIMRTIIIEHIDHLGKYCKSGERFDIWPIFQQLTLDIVLTISSGVQMNSLENKGDSRSKRLSNDDMKIGETLRTAIRNDIESFDVSAGLGTLFLFPDMPWFAEFVNRYAQTEKGKRGIQGRKVLVDTFGKILDRIGKSIDDKSENNIDRDSFIASMSMYGEKESKMWAIAQTYLFNAAGFETTANAMSFMCYLLATNPEKQRLLLEEISSFGRNRVPTYEDLDKLTYLEACFMESLRLLPPAPFAIRKLPKDTNFGKYTIPKDSWMQNMSWVTHRSSEYWVDSLSFKPERFIQGQLAPGFVAQKNPGFFPFGGGARKCPGYKFAQQEALLALLTLLQKYRVELPEHGGDIKLTVDITLSPKESGINLVLKKW